MNFAFHFGRNECVCVGRGGGGGGWWVVWGVERKKAQHINLLIIY